MDDKQGIELDWVKTSAGWSLTINMSQKVRAVLAGGDLWVSEPAVSESPHGGGHPDIAKLTLNVVPEEQ